MILDGAPPSLSGGSPLTIPDKLPHITMPKSSPLIGELIKCKDLLKEVEDTHEIVKTLTNKVKEEHEKREEQEV